MKRTTRRAMLLVIAVTQILIGVSWVTPTLTLASRADSVEWLLWLESWHIGAALCASGLISLSSVGLSWVHSSHREVLERWGFAASMAVFSGIALWFFASWILGGAQPGMTSGLVYSALAAITYLSAGVVDDPCRGERGD